MQPIFHILFSIVQLLVICKTKGNIFSYLRGYTTPDTIDEIQVDKYLGEWYQVYGAPTNYLFQGYGTCLTAEYGLLENGNISVINSQIDLTNELEQIRGYAYYKNASEPGKLSVHLNGVPVDGPYWIVKLGEIVNEQYQYSIITSPSSISLWVITRDVYTFKNKYDTEVLNYLDENNYEYLSIYQEDDCIYSFTE